MCSHNKLFCFLLLLFGVLFMVVSAKDALYCENDDGKDEECPPPGQCVKFKCKNDMGKIKAKECTTCFHVYVAFQEKGYTRADLDNAGCTCKDSKPYEKKDKGKKKGSGSLGVKPASTILLAISGVMAIFAFAMFN